MKQERVWLPLVILVLIIISAYVVFAKTHDKSHRLVQKFPIHYGLDINGGVRAVFQADIKNLPPDTPYDQSLVLKTLEERIYSSGVTEATVQPKGQYQFIAELPDVHDKMAILARLGTTAQMVFYYFQNVQCTRDKTRPVSISTTTDSTGRELYSFTDSETHQTFRDGAQIRGDFTKVMEQGATMRPGATLYTVPASLADELSQPTVYFTPDQQQQTAKLGTEMDSWRAFLANSPVILRGSDIKPNSHGQLGENAGEMEPEVTQEFTDKGAQEMGDFTGAHVGEIMGIVLDDGVLSAPVIQSQITDQGEISGGFATLTQAQDLANLLNAGALPVPLTMVQTDSVAASLGAGVVAQSIKAGVAGLVLVLVFMVFWYRVPGLLADIALLIYTLFTLAIYKGALQPLGLDPITLTLPGIAGFILSIGMAVDANILIFERLKEELRSGKSLRAAIDAGFRRAFPAIRDSNICTMITCVVLLSLGSPSVKGFAMTLLIGVIVSLFSAITLTRTLLFFLVEANVANNPALFGYKPDSAGASQSKLNIIGLRKYFYALSVFIIVPGCIFWAMGGLKRGIEFTGGTQMEVKYVNQVTQDQVLAALRAGHIREPLVQMAVAEDGHTEAIVSTTYGSDVALTAGENLVHQELTSALGTLGSFSEESFGKVDGTISADLTNNAIQAVVIAAIVIVLYLAIVFSIGGFVAGLRLGTSAIVALLHDVLVLIGTFAFLGYTRNWKIDSLFLTATLTVIGFSVHNTVVIFDRIRENLRHRVKGQSFEELVNFSTLQTMNRSIRTSGTVLLTLGALMIFGAQSTYQLNFALFIGVLSGTYSAICNASSILVDWENWLAKRHAAAPVGSASTAKAVAAPATAKSTTASVRPLPSRPTSIQAAVDTSDDDGISISRVKKKKKQARRF